MYFFLMCVEYIYVEILLRPVLVLGHLHVDTIIVRVCLVLVNSVRNDLDILLVLSLQYGTN